VKIRSFVGAEGQRATRVDGHPGLDDGQWCWLDIELSATSDDASFEAALSKVDLDAMALSDAFNDVDLPKIDDFEDHLLIVLHGIADNDEPTLEIDFFLTEREIITIRRHHSPALDEFAKQLERRPELSSGGPSEVMARMGDTILRRFLTVMDDLDDRVDELTDMGLEADPEFLEELTIVRRYVGELRHVLRPQRDVLDRLRRTPSHLVTDGGRRRFSDVYDTANRTVQELEGTRTALAETLGAYRGAEARQATEVTKILTVYAAIVLPLSLIAGLFGMNFVEIPGADHPNGWWLLIGAMAALAATSLLLFAMAGWIRLPRLHQSIASRVWVPERARQRVELSDAMFEPSD
jgi:magnesium transporter